jgi:transposase
MLSFSSRQRYFLYRGATDMRKGFNGLSGLVREHISHELMSGDAFIFLNKRRDRVKILVWDRTGFVVWYKVLEQGTFEMPAAEKQLEQGRHRHSSGLRQKPPAAPAALPRRRPHRDRQQPNREQDPSAGAGPEELYVCRLQ